MGIRNPNSATARMVALILSVVLIRSGLRAADPAEKSRTPAAITTLAAGRAQALLHRQPLFVIVRTRSCVWCRKLDTELNNDTVKKELERWVVVKLDLEKSENDVKPLLVTSTPALRVMTPTGRVLFSQDGYLAADKLTAWLKEHYEKASTITPAELADAGPPTAVALEKILMELGARDPLAREAAVRRLMPHPQIAAASVAEAFADGPLQTRLSALELLQAWKAPIQELDPWRPITLTEGRRQALRNWARAPGKTVAGIAAVLSPDELRQARQELARMLRGTDAEAAAAREHLARFGTALRPEVLTQLTKAETDNARERLTALRYRLAAVPARALDWAGGFERLAATTDTTRQRAAQELAERANGDDEALLLELFTSPDPLVREISLRALQEIAGTEAAGALVQLLADPVPNVRAAVLKQLAQSPAPGMIAKVVEYVGREKDPDLVVHAVRVLRESGSGSAIHCLKNLLTHESWRVRAEAAESLAAVAKNHRGRSADTEVRADIYAMLIGVLDDRDGFVVSRGMAGLQSSDLVTAVEPLLKVAERHPELTVEVIKTLYSSEKMRRKAKPKLLAFGEHANADVRAAAIQGLSNLVYSHTPVEEVVPNLKAALKDPDSRVRQAAATTLFRVLSPQSQDRPGAFGTADVMDLVSNFFKPKKRPTWHNDLKPLVLSMLSAEAAEERLHAALAAIALGEDVKGVPVLAAVAKARPDQQGAAAAALPWLPWDKRLAFFNQLVELRPDPEELGSIVNCFVSEHDARTAPRLWELFRLDFISDENAGNLLRALMQAHFGSRYHERDKMSAADRKAVTEVTRARAESGSALQRLVALALLASADLDEAGTLAKKIMNDDRAPADLRGDAFQIYLLTLTRKDFLAESIAALTGSDAARRRTAARALTLGAGDLHLLQAHKFYVSIDNRTLHELSRSRGEIIVPEAPRGLKAEPLVPLLKDPDPQVAACAGYLLALLGDPAGLDKLVRHWREQPRDNEEWTRLVYRAVAVLGDDSNVRLLEEIYRSGRLTPYGMGEFYWTIRAMEGPNALRLRKQLRHEVGMEHLR